MKMTDLSENLLVQNGRQVLKVSTIYPPTQNGGSGYVTAQVVYPVPPRTTVNPYLPDEVEKWREPSDHMLARYKAAWLREEEKPHDFETEHRDDNLEGVGPCAVCGLPRNHVFHR